MSMPKSGRTRRWRGYLLLLHPGPSAVCTTVTTLAGWSAWRQARSQRPGPGPWRSGLAWGSAAMALAQASTGVLNDAFDAPWDRLYQTYKPIPSGLVPRGHAWAIGLATGGLALLCAARAGSSALRVMAIGLASGWSYSLGLSRSPLSFVPFAAGLATVPVLGPAAVRARLPQQGQVTMLAAGLGLGLHLANGEPDIERDRMAGRRSLPVLLGASGSRLGSELLLVAGAIAVVVGTPPEGRRWAMAAATVTAGLLLGDRGRRAGLRSAGSHPFVVPALAGGSLAAGWLLGQSRAIGGHTSGEIGHL
ncbi:MAG TPA: UbiA family prenyltransferase [Candidatus Dormibacteraeota bacterium]